MSEINLQVPPMCCGNCVYWDGDSFSRAIGECTHRDVSGTPDESGNIVMVKTLDMSICTRWKKPD